MANDQLAFMNAIEGPMRAHRVDYDGALWALLCPKCDCAQILAADPDNGTPARCYECMYEFTITESCWKIVTE